MDFGNLRALPVLEPGFAAWTLFKLFRVMDDDTDNELRNPFPSPPSHYTKYTSHNLRLLALLNDRTAGADLDEPINQHQRLSDQKDVPEWPLTQLEKPRVDWILEEPDAYYEVFGDRWFVKERIPSLAELGGTQLYPADPSVDRRPALNSVLKSLLLTYSSLISSLLLPPPINPDVRPEWQRQVEWINVLSQNLMAAANDLRPMQARCNLEIMMQRQLDQRREETKTIHAKCDALEEKLKELRASALDSSIDTLRGSLTGQQRYPATSAQLSSERHQSKREDVLSWSEEI